MRLKLAMPIIMLMVAMCLVGSSTPTVEAADAGNQSVGRILVVPDSQTAIASEALAGSVTAQFDWIVDNAAASNTIFVSHVGDVVQSAQSTEQWDRIDPLFDQLEAAGIAYGIAPGNHDLVDADTEVLYDSVLFDPVTELNTTAADVDNSGSTDIIDALLIAQCSAGISNGLCPSA